MRELIIIPIEYLTFFIMEHLFMEDDNKLLIILNSVFNVSFYNENQDTSYNIKHKHSTQQLKQIP